VPARRLERWILGTPAYRAKTKDGWSDLGPGSTDSIDSDIPQDVWRSVDHVEQGELENGDPINLNGQLDNISRSAAASTLTRQIQPTSLLYALIP
jgi:hypothetical protein